KIAFVNCLATVRNMMGSLDSIKKIVNIKGYVASTADFINQPEVMNAVSFLANEVFGEAGKHSRAALGTASLPGGTPVE
ncbi:RidA family protein, partial [Peribacillus sp. SIMBA_075]